MLHFSSLDPWLIKGWLALLTNYSPIKSASELLPPIQTPVPRSSVRLMMLGSCLTDKWVCMNQPHEDIPLHPAQRCKALLSTEQHTAFHTHPSQLVKLGGTSWRGRWSSNRLRGFGRSMALGSKARTSGRVFPLLSSASGLPTACSLAGSDPLSVTHSTVDTWMFVNVQHSIGPGGSRGGQSQGLLSLSILSKGR